LEKWRVNAFLVREFIAWSLNQGPQWFAESTEMIYLQAVQLDEQPGYTDTPDEQEDQRNPITGTNVGSLAV
jgi:hypothetical protein